eukprot:EG_transcript_211
MSGPDDGAIPVAAARAEDLPDSGSATVQLLAAQLEATRRELAQEQQRGDQERRDLEDELRAMVRKVEELQAANAALQLSHSDKDLAAALQRLEEEMKELRLKKREVEAQQREAEERGELMSASLKERERKHREREQASAVRLEEREAELRGLRSRTAEQAMEIEELQDELAALERRLSEAEGAQQAALQELRELREANEDFRAREAVFERLTEEMNDAMAKWKEDMLDRLTEAERQATDAQRRYEAAAAQVAERDEAISKLEKLVGQHTGGAGSWQDDAVQSLHAEKIKTLERYNEVLCGELERKKEEVKEAARRLQERETDVRDGLKALDRKDAALRELGLRLETAEQRHSDAVRQTAALIAEVEQRDAETLDLRVKVRELTLALKKAEEAQHDAQPAAREGAISQDPVGDRPAEADAELVASLEASLRQLQRENELQARKLSAAHAEVQERDAELERKREELAELQTKRRAELEQRLAQLDANMQASHGEVDRLQQRITILEEEKLQAELQAKHAEESVELVSGQLSALKQEFDQTWERLQESDSLCLERDTQVRELTLQSEALAKSLQTTEDRLRQAEAKGAALAARAEEAAVELAALRKLHAAALTEKEILQTEIECMSNQSDVLSIAEIEDKEEEIRTLRGKAAEAAETMAALRCELQEKHKALQKALQAVHNLEVEAAELRVAAERSQADTASLQRRLDAAQQQLDERAQTTAALHAQLVEAQRETVQLTGERDGLALSLQKADEDRRTKRQELEGRHQRQLQQMKDKLAEREAELKEEAQAMEALQAERVQELTAARQALIEEAERWKKEAKALQRKVQESEWQVEDVQREVARLQKEVSSTGDRRRDATDKGRGFESQLLSLRKQVGSLEAEARQLRDSLAEEQLARSQAEEAADAARKALLWRTGELEAEQRRLACELDLRVTQVAEVQAKLQQRDREGEALKKGLEEKERRISNLVDAESARSRALVVQAETRLRESEATQLQKYDQELALMQRRVITLQETVKTLDCQLRETQDQLREAEAGAQATAAGIERRDAAARELETRLADRDEELRLARDRADAAREQCQRIEEGRSKLTLQMKEERSRWQMQREELSSEFETRLLQKDRELGDLQEQLQEYEGEIVTLREKKRAAELQGIELRQRVEQSQEEAETQRQALAQLAAERQRLQAEAAETRLLVADLRDVQLTEAKAQRQQLTDEVAGLQAELAAAREEADAVSRRLDEQEAQTRKAVQQLNVALHELAQRNVDLQTLQTQLESVKEDSSGGELAEQMDLLRARLRTAESERSEAEAREQRLREAMADLPAEGPSPAMESELLAATEEAEQLRGVLRRKEVQVSTLQSQLREAQAEMESRRAEAEALKVQTRLRSTELSEHQARIVELEASLRQQQRQADETQTRIERAFQATLRDMETALRETEGRLQDANGQRQRAVKEAEQLRADARLARQATARRDMDEVLSVEELSLLRRRVKELEEAQGSAKQLKEECQSLRGDLIDKEERIRTLRAEKTQLLDKAAEAEEQVAELERALRLSEAELRTVREDLQQKQLEVRRLNRTVTERDRQLDAASKRDSFTNRLPIASPSPSSSKSEPADRGTLSRMQEQLSLLRQPGANPLAEKMQQWKREDEERRQRRELAGRDSVLRIEARPSDRTDSISDLGRRGASDLLTTSSHSSGGHTSPSTNASSRSTSGIGSPLEGLGGTASAT